MGAGTNTHVAACLAPGIAGRTPAIGTRPSLPGDVPGRTTHVRERVT